MNGPWWEPRIQPATIRGVANGSMISPTAGRPFCPRTIITGSSFPTYFPAIRLSRCVLVEAPIRPSFRQTYFITYREGAPM